MTNVNQQNADHFTVSTQTTYDKIVDQYDDYWTRHVLSQHARLTRDLNIQRGERIVDIACGCGTTLEMMRLNIPGETVAVDLSPKMLAKAKEVAAQENLELTCVCSSADTFIAESEADAFDVLSLRFGLAYVNWRSELGRLGRLVRKGRGRVGLLSNLATSAPQALTTYHEFMDAIGMEKAWPPVPTDTAEIAALLAEGGLRTTVQWTERMRLWFSSGMEVADWLMQSGYITSPTIASADEDMLAAFAPIFAARLEEKYGEDKGVPLDFDIGCVIAVRDA